MKRRDFVQKAAAVPLVSAVGLGSLEKKKAMREYYELRTYQLKSGGGLRVMGDYLSQAAIPAMQRAGISSIGVFTEYGKTDPPKLYTLIVYPSIEHFAMLNQKLAEDAEYQEKAKTYLSFTPDKAVYERVESAFMEAFMVIPKLEIPTLATGKQARLIELRIYESHNEDAGIRKVKMFNEEEIALFRKIGLTPVFFGQNLTGQQLPCLSYMLVFPNMVERDAKWKVFVEHPEWAAMRDKPVYANTVSKVVRIFLEPTDYSQI